MTLHIPYAIALGVILKLTCAEAACAAELRGRVVSVTDGDTLVVLDSGNVQHKVRLAGIDAPERKQAFGTRATGHLKTLVHGRDIRVMHSKRDRHARIVGKVLLQDVDVNLVMIKDGLAWHYKQYEREQTPEDRARYATAESSAKSARRGLWSDTQPIPPWSFRVSKSSQRR